MATVNLSVPDHVKESFNRTFEGENKSAVIARLMQEAIDDAVLVEEEVVDDEPVGWSTRPIPCVGTILLVPCVYC
jgi:hypothetical protein